MEKLKITLISASFLLLTSSVTANDTEAGKTDAKSTTTTTTSTTTQEKGQSKKSWSDVMWETLMYGCSPYPRCVDENQVQPPHDNSTDNSSSGE